MSKLLYAKYNSLRKPQYQLATFIKEQDTEKIVIKHPINPAADKQIQAILDNKKKISGLYNSIQIIDAKLSSNEQDLEFPFIEGKSLISGLDLRTAPLSEIVKVLTQIMHKIFDYSDTRVHPFKMSPDFLEVFKAYTKIRGDAVSGGNFDANIDNFIETNDGIVCIDYEWVFDFDIPIDYLKFRTLYYFYDSHAKELAEGRKDESTRIAKDEFLTVFGFSKAAQLLYTDMEYAFQEYIYGDGVERLYLDRYKKSEQAAGPNPAALLKNPVKTAFKAAVTGREMISHTLSKSKRAELTEHVKVRREMLEKEVNPDYSSWIERVEEKREESRLGEFDYSGVNDVHFSIVIVEDKNVHGKFGSVRESDNYMVTLESLNKQSHQRFEVTDFANSTGEYVIFLMSGTVLKKDALHHVADAVYHTPYLDLVYADEDFTDERGKRVKGHFKPEWSPDTFQSYLYTGSMNVVRRSLCLRINQEIRGFDSLHMFLKQALKNSAAKNIRHIPEILCSSPIENFEEQFRHDMARLMDPPKCDANAKVSIIIPSKDNPEVIEKCLESLSRLTLYKNYEIIIIDNGSSDPNMIKYKILRDKLKEDAQIDVLYEREEMTFNFSKMCNLGASRATGEYLLFLNDDMEIIDGNWLTNMISKACEEHVGAVGAKLYYPGTKLIQHVGVVSLASGPVHIFSGMKDTQPLYFGRNYIDYNVSAVTAACLLVSKEKFDKVGGFDESMAVAYNDIDLCYKLYEQGYYNVVKADAILYHHESLSRGDDKMDANKLTRLMDEQEKLYEKHPKFRGKDPYYSNMLTQTGGDSDVNYDIFDEFAAVHEPYAFNYKRTLNLKGSIDIARADWCVYIEGWAVEMGALDNIDTYPEILLRSKNESYRLTTEKVKRPDVASALRFEYEVEYSGFKTQIDRKAIENGTYEICILYKGRVYETDKTLEKYC